MAVYYHTTYAGQNLARVKNQLTLLDNISERNVTINLIKQKDPRLSPKAPDMKRLYFYFFNGYVLNNNDTMVDGPKPFFNTGAASGARVAHLVCTMPWLLRLL